MKFFLLLFIFVLLELAALEEIQHVDSAVDMKREPTNGFHRNNPNGHFSCVSVYSAGRVSACPKGYIATGCACGYGCGSWNIAGETVCHCLCAVIDWANARCCRLDMGAEAMSK